MGNEPRKLADVMTAGALADLAREAERRRLTTADIRSKLPAAEAEHLVSASLNSAGELVLVMDAPAWAARVRYCVSELGTEPVRIKVLPRSR
ncbi:MAG TPA: hypothetical protein VFJ95_15710 [Gammaproteobacteria bacterium]|nr:hypothetical protein [Gammaproteobacteria bacterium]